MNRQEILAVLVIFALLLGWMWNQSRLARETPPAPRPTPEAPPGPGPEDPVSVAVDPEDPGIAIGRPPEAPAVADSDAPPAETAPETILTCAVDSFSAVFSSRGATVRAVTLSDFPATLESDDAFAFDFETGPALALAGPDNSFPMLDFKLDAMPGGTGVVAVAAMPGGLRMERMLVLAPDYRIIARDRFSNDGQTPQTLAGHKLYLGMTDRGPADSDTVGIDSLADIPGAKIRFWERRDLPALFNAASGGLGCAAPPPPDMPLAAAGHEPLPQQWIGAKTRFFVQLLRTDMANDGMSVEAWRAPEARAFRIKQVRPALVFPARILQPGETVERTATLYVGPKKLSVLQRLGHGQEGVMQFGFFGWMCRLLLPTLNGLHAVFGNYGIAIILLTLMVRVIFWPVTHRSTESMKKMQAIQPEIKALQKKFKESPQQLQQETWKLYREHKVNPLSSCLPMLIQIPVFIALFTVLRSAVELRFASFLWIRDLSEPERLFQDWGLPFSVNILPLLMAATMAWQQHLTPASGDPQQRKMMMFMPVMMLFFFYSMPSALVLYWTVSQVASIVQLLLQQQRGRAGGAGKTGLALEPPRWTRQMRRQANRSGTAESPQDSGH